MKKRTYKQLAKWCQICQHAPMKKTRPISWIRAARKDFEDFPDAVQHDMLTALTIAAEGEKSDNAKPLKGIDGGVLEIAVRYRGGAFRVVYAVKIGGGYLGNSCFPKKIKDRDQDASNGY